MQLDKFTDYALRILIALSAHAPEKLSSAKIAAIYQLSEHHLAKIASHLAREGFVTSERGRNGGLTLSRDATEINIGHVVRRLKADTPVVECFGPNQSCRILPVCGLRNPLQDAQEAFFAVLDRFTLADVTGQNSALADLLSVKP